MAERRRSGKLAVILHADVAGSTTLVQQDEDLAHERIQDSFRRFSDTITKYHGHVRELRGDALLAEFERASDAVPAALAFQAEQTDHIAQLDDTILPEVRVGIAMGEVIVADNTVTGAGVVLAQRVEQLAEPGGLCITGAIHEALPQRMPFVQANLGEQQLKGFDEPIRVYRVELTPGESTPPPAERGQPKSSPKRRGLIAAVAVIVLVVAGGLGYWFQPWPPKEEPASLEHMAFPLPDKPSIAILPFSDLSDSDEHTYIADGLTENIIATLGKISGLFVIDRGAVTRYSDASIKAHQVSEELGVRYILKGSVQKSGGRLRVTTTLVDTSTGHHIWSERYDRDITDLFSVQDEVTGRIVVELQVNLMEGEQARLKYDSTTNFDAWANFMRGSDSFYRFTKEDNAKARELFERAVDLDPQYAIALSWLAWTHWIDARFGYSESREVSFTRAEELVAKAVELDPELADALSLLGAIHLYKREYDEALDKGRMAIDLGPNNANIHATVAITTYSVGDWGETIKLLKRAMRLSPYYPSWYLLYLGRAQTFQGDYKEAITTQEKGLARADSLKSAFHAALAFVHMEAGNEQQARASMAQTLEVRPHYSASYVKKVNFFKDTNDLDRLIGALQKAGMPEHPPLKLPDKPSIAVLPFTNMSDDPQQEYFVDGMTEDLITDLSKLSELFVIARNSSFTYKGKAVDVKNVARDLGVRYVMEGSVRRVGNQVRINAQLIDATTGGHLWAERYDGLMDDVFALQDRVTREIVAALAVSLASEQEAGQIVPETLNPKAYDSLLKGWTYYRRNTPEDLAKAVIHLEKAIEIDPNYSRAYAALAAVYQAVFNKNWFSGTSSWNQKLGITTDQVIHKEQEYLDLAMRDPDPLAYRVLSHRLSWKGEHEAAISAANTAIKLNPNDPISHEALAIALIYAGDPENASKQINQAIRLDPQYPSEYLFWLGLARFGSQDFKSAVDILVRATQSNPDNEVALLVLAATYGHLGEPELANTAIKEANRLRQNRQDLLIEAGLEHGVDFLLAGPYTLADVSLWPFKLNSDRERLSQGLRLAGVLEASEGETSPVQVVGAKTIDAAEAKQLFDTGARFIDVRGKDSWMNGHIPGAVNLPLKEVFSEANLSAVVAIDEPFIVYCMGPRCLLSSKACQKAVEWGYRHVHYFRDGFPSWKSAGYQIEVK